MSESKFEVGSIVEGKVLKLKPFGAIVELDSSTQGLIHISQVANGFVQDINDHLKEGDVVKIKIMTIDPESGKISLSLREAQPQQAAPPRKPFNNSGSNNRRPYQDGGNGGNGGNRSNSNYRSNNTTQDNRSSAPVDPMAAFEDKLKEWNKQATERQAGINKRNNNR
jgi:general stress protein 13/S1 RNA binding domain protein